MSEKSFFPFQLIGKYFFPGHETLFGLLDGFLIILPFFLCLAFLLILGLVVLPAILNKKFDEEFLSSSKGGIWIEMKRPAFPAYHYYRARDYARAVISEKQAKRIFDQPSAVFRNRVSKTTAVMCHILVFSERFFATSLLLFLIVELFGL